MPAAQHTTNKTPNIQRSDPTNNMDNTHIVDTNDRCTINDNHSNVNIDEIHETTDLDRCRISECPEETCLYTIGRCEHKRVLYGKGSVMKKWVVDVYGGARQAADLNFKCEWDAREWLGAVGRTMEACAHTAALLVLLALLATGDAAPAPFRSPRSAHHEKSVRSYLESFGYLKRGRLEMANLLMGDQAKDYEDDFRIAIKTLQEFGGIPVTGEVDEATKRLMRQKRCGRPDRETDEGRRMRRKRFAVQGEMWKHTNLTWRYVCNGILSCYLSAPPRRAYNRPPAVAGRCARSASVPNSSGRSRSPHASRHSPRLAIVTPPPHSVGRARSREKHFKSNIPLICTSCGDNAFYYSIFYFRFISLLMQLHSSNARFIGFLCVSEKETSNKMVSEEANTKPEALCGARGRRCRPPAPASRQKRILHRFQFEHTEEKI